MRADSPGQGIGPLVVAPLWACSNAQAVVDSKVCIGRGIFLGGNMVCHVLGSIDCHDSSADLVFFRSCVN